MSKWWTYLWTHWAEPLGPLPAGLRPALGVLALILRLYAGGVTGFLLGLAGLHDLGMLTNIGFLPYGVDKLLGGNERFAMGPEFFEAVGTPLPALTAGMVGALELFGSLALIAGLLTRPAALALAGTMVVALWRVGNWPEELPLLVACLLLVWLGGGLLALDSPLAGRRPAAPGTILQQRPL